MTQLWGKIVLILSLILGGSSMTVVLPTTLVATVTPQAIVASHTIAKTTMASTNVIPTTFVNPNPQFMEVHAPILQTPVIVKSSVPTTSPITTVSTSTVEFGASYEIACRSTYGLNKAQEDVCLAWWLAKDPILPDGGTNMPQVWYDYYHLTH